MDYITLLSILIGFIALAIYLKSPNKSNEENQEKIILDKLNNDIKDLSHQNGQNRQEINDLQKRLEISLTKVESYLYSYGVPVSILFASILIVDFSDRVLISYFLSFEELAVYSASYDLIQRTFGAILGVAYIAYFPRIAAFWEKNDKAKVELMLSNLFIIIIILGTYIGIFVSLFYEYFSLLIGQEIRNTPKFLAILISIGILFGALKFYVLETLQQQFLILQLPN